MIKLNNSRETKERRIDIKIDLITYNSFGLIHLNNLKLFLYENYNRPVQ